MNPILALALRLWQPIVCVVAVACIALALRGYGKHRFAAGESVANTRWQVKWDAREAAIAKTVAESQERERIANAAAHATYEAQHAQTLIAARVPVGTGELCKPAPQSPVRAERAAADGAQAQVPTARVAPSLPAADPRLTYDRPGLLGAFAALSADEAAVIEEFQARAQLQ